MVGELEMDNFNVSSFRYTRMTVFIFRDSFDRCDSELLRKAFSSLNIIIAAFVSLLAFLIIIQTADKTIMLLARVY